MKFCQTLHGGNLDYIEREYNISRGNIVDFTGNINPFGIPTSAKNIFVQCDIEDMMKNYPDKDYFRLKQCIGKYVNTPEDNIIVGNGSTEMISLLISALRPRKYFIIVPTYSEYQREAMINNGKVSYYTLPKDNEFKVDVENFIESLSYDMDILIFCNPNNPTGVMLENDDLEKILWACKKFDIFVLIDECYIEFTDSVSAIDLLEKFDNVLVVRGTSKFFGLAGIRLGYAVTSNRKIKNEMEKIKDPWSVNSIAAKIGEVIFSDNKFINITMDAMKKEKAFIRNEFKNIDWIRLYDTSCNFFMGHILRNDIDAEILFNELLKQNLIERNLSDFHSLDNYYFRFCIQTHENNFKLLNAIKSLGDRI